MVVRKIGTAQRQARLAVRHHLAPSMQGGDPATVARGIGAYHATDPATVYLAAAARTGFAAPSVLEAAMFDDRTLVRMLGMRRTMFVIAIEQWPAIHTACTRDIAARNRRQTLKFLAEGGITDDAEGWLRRAEATIMAALSKRGGATTQEVSADVPEVSGEIVLAPGKPYESKQKVTPLVLQQLAAEARIVRTRPVKSWASANRWAVTDDWLPDVALDMPEDAAVAQLARSWLWAFGPGTLEDLKWWAGWTVGRARKALAAVDAAQVEMDDGRTGYVLPDDLEPVAEPEPWAGFLPSLDPAVMGWAMAGRDWYLDGPARDVLYDRSGNIGPTVWWGGRVVGGWAQRADGTIAFRLFDDIGADGSDAVADIAGRLEAWLADVRVKPRFPTPIDQELSQG